MTLFEVTLSATFANQQIINRWNYIGGGTPAAVTPSFGLASAFGAVYDEVHVPPQYPTDSILAQISALVSDQVSFQQLTVINLYDPTDFYQTPFVPAYNGTQNVDSLSPAVAYGFRTNQVRRDVARATKRFAGVTENRVTNQGQIVSAQYADFDLLATRMTDVLEYDDEGNTLTYTPAVCGKLKYSPPSPPAKAGAVAYKYYATLAEQIAHTASGVTWEAYRTTRTQTSRQYGHGQ